MRDFAAWSISSGLAAMRRTPYFFNSSGYSRVGIALTGNKLEFPRAAHVNHASMHDFPECSSLGDPTDGSFAAWWRREFRVEESVFSMNGRPITSDSMDQEHYRERQEQAEAAATA